MRSHLLYVVAALGVAGCATGSSVERVAEKSQLTAAQAEQLVSAYEQRRALRVASANDPMHQPKNDEDLLTILKRDQIDLFPDGVRWAKANPSPRATALGAQTQIAWGEANQILGDLLAKASESLHQEDVALERKAAARPLSSEESARKKRLTTLLEELGGIEKALEKVGAQHLAEGVSEAQQLIATAPQDYVGYRIAADYHRLKGDWTKFDLMMTELEAKHPKSNGGLFLRGLEALERHEDREKAANFFRQALAHDPQFVRAQVQLLLLQTDIVATYGEYQKLKTLNPQHQIVVWAGPAIEDQYRIWTERQQRVRERSFNNAQQRIP